MNGQYPTNEVTWDQHRDLITQLYYRDGLSLSRVRAEMANKHRSKATDKMYKTRIKAWGLTKYVKHVGSTRVQKRERMARASVAVVSSDAAWQSRHYGNLAALPGVEFGSMSIDARSSEHKLVSALSESLSATLSLGRISAPEKMLFLSRDYFRYPRRYRFYGVFIFGFQTEINQSLVAVRKANFTQAKIHWRSIFDEFENMLTLRDGKERFMLDCNIQWLISALGKLVNDGVVEVASALQQHLASMASIKLPPKHPHRLLLEVLAGVDLHMMGWLFHALNNIEMSQGIIVWANWKVEDDGRRCRARLEKGTKRW